MPSYAAKFQDLKEPDIQDSHGGLEDDYHYIHRHVHQRLQHHRPRRAKIDGFRFGEDPGSGPFAWQITSPIK